MVKSQAGVVGSNNKTHNNNIQEEEDEADEYDSSSYRGRSSEQRKASNRSKHSETEQRRRSKINERFQILRNLIPQNDQKRDKASFLLEVIEYIQFLQEKIQMYEGPYQGWNQEPTKLTPWKNPQAPVEGLVDHSQVLNNGSSHETSSLLTNVHPFNVPTSSNMFAAAAGRGGVTAQSMQESVSDAENMTHQLQSPLWQGRPCATEFAAPGNAVNGQIESMNDGGSISFSNTYSQGILENLTQALRSSGVDLSKTSISVQIDVGKQANGASSSKDQENSYLNSHLMEQTGFGSSMEDTDQARKRLRMQKS